MKLNRHRPHCGSPTRWAWVALYALLSLAAITQQATAQSTTSQSTTSKSTTSKSTQATTPLTVFAAASLKESMDEVAAAYEAASGVPVRVSYAGSSVLARQIEQGAPADVFFSADLAWMDYLQQHGKVEAAKRHNLLGNQLVLVAPASRPLQVDPAVPGSIAAALGKQRLAVGLTNSVPAGKYARQALQSTRQWNSVKDQLAEAENVRAALMLVARGEVPLGIVYLSDAKAEPKVDVAGMFATSSHSPIIYPVAALQGPHLAAAQELVAWLASAPARAIFVRRGFEVLEQD